MFVPPKSKGAGLCAGGEGGSRVDVGGVEASSDVVEMVVVHEGCDVYEMFGRDLIA